MPGHESSLGVCDWTLFLGPYAFDPLLGRLLCDILTHACESAFANLALSSDLYASICDRDAVFTPINDMSMNEGCMMHCPMRLAGHPVFNLRAWYKYDIFKTYCI